MDEIVVTGGRPLTGSVRASGSKNGTLPLLAAALLVDGETVLDNIPTINDVIIMIEMLRALGAKCEFVDRATLKIDASTVNSVSAPYDLVRRMRGSFYVAGPLLARFGKCEVPLPGGCVIGSRPVDFHIAGFKALGAEVDERHGVMRAEASRLKGTRIFMDPRSRSVGATVNLMLAASMAEGTTIIENASREPEVVSCQKMLQACGLDIQGIDTPTVTIRGTRRLHETSARVIPDRMEAGTFLYAAAAAMGDITVEAVVPRDLELVLDVLRRTGAGVTTGEDWIRLRSLSRPLPVDIMTAPFPGFPTDLQPTHGALASIARGTTIIEETIFDARYNYTDELARMGAHIRIVDSAAIIKGQPKLYAAPVEATDIRAGAALVVAALAAEGQTEISGATFLDRGYEDLVGKLRGLGAEIVRRGAGASERAVCLG
ncbi:MAG: UDP-N-acetylglucosamine 1-carboxyvinyltransferase [Armatimonadetes bacterium]|nr:UDP-N-acetylglucosamine 1-carboxyvinyltransferase [Armatimonadota bacterium]